jgi:hypothetical protein
MTIHFYEISDFYVNFIKDNTPIFFNIQLKYFITLKITNKNS